MNLSWKPWELLGIAAVVTWAGTIRLKQFNQGITSDEVGLLQFHGWSRILTDTLNANHPPLYRMAFSSWLEPLEAIQWGRGVAYLFSLLTIIAVIYLTRQVTQSRTLGLVAGAMMSVLPVAIRFSAYHRPYAVLIFLCTVHVIAINAWLNEDKRSTAQWWVMLTAVAMVQTHYLSVPWLFFTGTLIAVFFRSRWVQLRVYLPAFLSLVPLTKAVLKPQNNFQRAPGNIEEAIHALIGMGLHHRGAPAWMTSDLTHVVIAILVIHIACIRWLNKRQLVVLLSTVALILSIVVLSQKHQLTHSTQLIAAPLMICLTMSTAAIQRPPYRFLRVPFVFATLYGVVCWMHLSQSRYKYDVESPRQFEQLQEFIQNWSDWVEPEEDVVFEHSSAHAVAQLLLTGQLYSNTVLEGCDQRRCFVFDNHKWRIDKLEHLPKTHASIFVFKHRFKKEALPIGCSTINTPETLSKLARCKKSASRDDHEKDP